VQRSLKCTGFVFFEDKPSSIISGYTAGLFIVF
jgi:hypothetical protein